MKALNLIFLSIILVFLSNISLAANKPFQTINSDPSLYLTLFKSSMQILNANGAFANINQIQIEELISKAKTPNKAMHDSDRKIKVQMDDKNLFMNVVDSEMNECGIRFIKAQFATNDIQTYGLLKFQLLLVDARKNHCQEVQNYPIAAQLVMHSENTQSTIEAAAF